MRDLKEPEFFWDEENYIAKCVIKLDNPQYEIITYAHCHPEDVDMCNEKTGCQIAYQRAIIKLIKWYKHTDINPRLAALKQLYYSMTMSNNFNPKSYENIMLQRQIRLLENELTEINKMIDDRYVQLDEYLKKKEHFYQMVRSMRRVKEEERKHEQ